MKRSLFFLGIIGFFISCKNNKKETVPEKDNRIALRTNTVNIVKMSDTLIIYESTCRGCAYEGSTHFSISDSLEIIKLSDVKTIDNNSPDVNGGNVSKHLLLIPLKTGTTTIRLYKFWDEKETAKDSAHSRPYTIEVRN